MDEELTRHLADIEALPLDVRAEALLAVHDELLSRLGAADAAAKDG